jgi:hypothetical protein
MPNISPENTINIRKRYPVASVQAIKPVWVRIPVAAQVTGLSRSRIFTEIILGTIKSKHLKSPGKERGIRLIHLDSLLEFIEGQES